MPNRKQFKIIKQGVEVWNRWRDNNPNIEINLSDANLSYDNLSNANLSGANLKRVQALATNFEGANLTGACIEDWNINSETNFKGLICDYIYLKENKRERRPSDPEKNFYPGELTRLVEKSVETVDFIFTDGIDWNAFLASFHQLLIEYGDDELAMQAIEKKSGDAFVIRLNVPPSADKAEIESFVSRLYSSQLKAIEDKYRLEFNPQEIEINKKKSVDLLELAKLAANSSKSTLNEGQQEFNESILERSIEFPAEYWEAGNSILSYFSKILSIKYPNNKIKVRIEQEGLMLRMIIVTPTGEKEEIEKTLEEYGMVVTGRLEAENFLNNPLEVMALKNKLEIANLELRQTRQLLALTTDNNQQRIESLETQVRNLHSIIAEGLQSGNRFVGVIEKVAQNKKSTYYLNQAKFGGGFASENGLQIGGSLIDLSNSNNLTDAAQQIQDQLNQLQNQGDSEEEAIQKAASDLAKQADDNPTVLGKLVKYGKFIADAAGKTTVSEAVKGVISLALQMSNI